MGAHFFTWKDAIGKKEKETIGLPYLLTYPKFF